MNQQVQELFLYQPSKQLQDSLHEVWAINQVKCIHYFSEFPSNTYLIDANNPNSGEFLKHMSNSQIFVVSLNIFHHPQGMKILQNIIVVSNQGTIIFDNITKQTPPIFQQFFASLENMNTFGLNILQNREFVAANYNLTINCQDTESQPQIRKNLNSFIKSQNPNLYKYLFETKNGPKSGITQFFVSAAIEAVSLYFVLLKCAPQTKIVNDFSQSYNSNSQNTARSPSSDFYPKSSQCPFCSKQFETFEEAIMHISNNHKMQSVLIKSFSNANDSECKFCNKSFNSPKAFIYHLCSVHRNKLLEIIRNNKPSNIPNRTKYQKFLNLFCQKWTVQEEITPDIQPKEEEENINSEADEDYMNYIASTIDVKGMASKDTASVSKVLPIQPKMLQTNNTDKESKINGDFWRQLDAMHATLVTMNKIETENGAAKCVICNKNCKTIVKLLQHCWEHHKDLVDSFA